MTKALRLPARTRPPGCGPFRREGAQCSPSFGSLQIGSERKVADYIKPLNHVKGFFAGKTEDSSHRSWLTWAGKKDRKCTEPPGLSLDGCIKAQPRSGSGFRLGGGGVEFGILTSVHVADLQLDFLRIG